MTVAGAVCARHFLAEQAVSRIGVRSHSDRGRLVFHRLKRYCSFPVKLLYQFTSKRIWHE